MPRPKQICFRVDCDENSLDDKIRSFVVNEIRKVADVVAVDQDSYPIMRDAADLLGVTDVRLRKMAESLNLRHLFRQYNRKPE